MVGSSKLLNMRDDELPPTEKRLYVLAKGLVQLIFALGMTMNVNIVE